MKKVNTDLEILEYAISREVEAYNFFMALSGRADSEKIQQAFIELANEELEHKAKLELEIMKSGKTVSTEMAPPRPENEYIFSEDPSPLDIDYQDLLLLCMEKEDASYKTYVKLAANIHEEHARETLIKLAEEEVKHKIRFEKEYEKLNTDK